MTEDQLEALIGTRVAYQGRQFLIVDWLAEGPALVLTEAHGPSTIQSDQFGEARRRVAKTWTIPVYADHSGNLHPLLRELTLS